MEGADWYLTDKDFTWTYAQTHEANCGPLLRPGGGLSLFPKKEKAPPCRLE